MVYNCKMSEEQVAAMLRHDAEREKKKQAEEAKKNERRRS